MQGRNRGARWEMMTPAALLAAFSGLEMVRRFYRDSHLFVPSSEPIVSWEPADYGFHPDQVDEVFFECDGNRLHGWYCRAEHPVASALYCHGNTGNLTKDLSAIRHFVQRGISVFTFDYRGFGKSSGHPGIRGVVRDAIGAAALHDSLRPAGIPSLLYGFSLGGAIAAQVARQWQFRILVLQSTFTCLREIARVVHASSSLHLLCGDEFDTLSVVKQLAIPIIVIHGSDDQAIPIWMGLELFRDAANARALLTVEGGSHGNLLDVAAERIVRTVRRLALDTDRETLMALAS